MERIINKLLTLGPLGLHENEIFEELGVDDGAEADRDLIRMGLRTGDREGWFIYEPPNVMPNRRTYHEANIDVQEAFERTPDGTLRWCVYHRRKDNGGAFERADNPEVFIRLPEDHEMVSILARSREVA